MALSWVAANWVTVAAVAVITGVNYLNAQSQQRKLKNRLKQLRRQRNGFLLNARSSEEPVRVVYGKHRVGGNQVYLNARGENNEYLDVILTLSEGPIESVEKIQFDDRDIADFGSDAYYEFFNGAGNQSLCATLQSVDPNWNDYMRWTAYLYLRLRFNNDKYSGFPNFTAEIQGRTLYDPRSGSTAWSDNPALVWYDFMTNARYGGGIDPSYIDIQSVIDAANWCDANGYKFNGVIYERQPFLDVLDDIMANFRAYVIWSDGTYRLKILDYDTPVMSVTENEIVADSVRINLPGLADTPNRVKIQYPDIGDNYVMKDLVVADETAVLQYDLEERDLELELIGTTDATQATKLATYHLERNSLNKTYTFAMHPRALALEPGDMIQVSHTLPGWTNRVVRVLEINLTQDGLAALTVQEEDAALYDDTVNLSAHTYFSTNLPSPLDVPPEATNVTFAEEEYYNKDVSYTRLKVQFTAPDSPFWSHSEVWVDVNGAGYNHYTNARGSFTIEPVEEGATYKIKLLSVSIHNAKQDISTATEYTHNVVGKNTPPDDVTGFTAIPQADTIVLMWDGVSNVDLLGYEIRKGTNWNGGIFIGFTKALTLQLNGVPPGTHTYMIKSVDTNNKYSDGYDMATVTLYGPASYTEKMSKLNDFSEPPVWGNSTNYGVGEVVKPSTPNGFIYECTVGGDRGTTEPTWPTQNGATVVDNQVTWTAYEAHSFDNTEQYNDPTNGLVLRSSHTLLGSELVSNGEFETDPNVEWNSTYSTLASVTGGRSGNCLEITRTVWWYGQSAYQTITGLTPGKTYRFSAWVKSGTSGDESASILVYNNGKWHWTSRYSSSTWQKFDDVTFTAETTWVTVYLRKNTPTAGTMLFDSASLYEIDLDGTYTSRVYDRGSNITRRAWPDFDHFFSGTGSTWEDQFSPTELWTDEFSVGDTWFTLFGPYVAGKLKMEFGYSTDGVTWNWLANFESYVAEVQARFVRYRVTIEDVDSMGYLCVKPVTYKEAYWQ